MGNTMEKTKTFDISVCLGSKDHRLFCQIINQGIDSRLTAFTKSNFHYDESRYYFDFATCELEILIRRLVDLETDLADLWAADIVLSAFGYETV